MSTILSSYNSHIHSLEKSKTFQRWRDPKEMWFPVKVTLVWETSEMEREELDKFESYQVPFYEVRIESKEGVFYKIYPYYAEAELRWDELCRYAKEDMWDEFDKVTNLYFEGKTKWTKE